MAILTSHVNDSLHSNLTVVLGFMQKFWFGVERGVAISRTMFLSPLQRVFFGVENVLHGFQ